MFVNPPAALAPNKPPLAPLAPKELLVPKRPPLLAAATAGVAGVAGVAGAPVAKVLVKFREDTVSIWDFKMIQNEEYFILWQS